MSSNYFLNINFVIYNMYKIESDTLNDVVAFHFPSGLLKLNQPCLNSPNMDFEGNVDNLYLYHMYS